MVAYHTAYDLQHFYSWDIDVFSGGWKMLQLTVASLFLLLVGASSSISHRHPLKRFIKIGAAALFVSIATYIIDPETYVRFGILHLIAVSAVILPPLRRLNAWLIVPGIALILPRDLIASIDIDSSFLIPFGIRLDGFTTVDYFPIVPWFGVILMGCGIGHLLFTRYANRKIFRLEAGKLRSLEALSWPGRHSLLLYLIHQPIIIGLLWLIFGTPPSF